MNDFGVWVIVFSVLAACCATGLYGIRFGCRVCAGFVPSFKESAIAIGWVCLASIPFAIINLVPAIKNNLAAQLSFLFVGLIISALILGAKLKYPEGGSIGFRKGGLVSLVWSGFGLVVVFVGGIAGGVLFGTILSTPKQQDIQPVSQAQEILPARQESLIQQEFIRAAQEIMAKFPQLDINSPSKNMAAIDYVVSARDGYVSKGYDIDIARRMAANDYAEALQRQVQRAPPQQAAASSGQAAPGQNWRDKQDARRKCNIQPVMTDAEIAACR